MKANDILKKKYIYLDNIPQRIRIHFQYVPLSTYFNPYLTLVK